MTLDARLRSVLGNSQRLDGGAMFGNVPREMWEQWAPTDEHHRIRLATRALLVQEASGRNVLLETGIGAFFEPELRDRYGVQEDRHVLIDNLRELGLAPDDIDIVVLSHLHFDHAGGLLGAHVPGRDVRLVFERAQIVVGAAAWERACQPHRRDRASFIPGLTTLLEDSGRLRLVDGRHSPVLGEGYTFHFSDGHTPGLMLTELDVPGGPVVFGADLVPGRAWIHLPVTMGYDRNAELVVDEKEELLADLVDRSGRLFLTHDPDVAMVTVERDERGRFRAGSEWVEVDERPAATAPGSGR